MKTTGSRLRWSQPVAGALLAALAWACTEPVPTAPGDPVPAAAAKGSKTAGGGGLSVSSVDPDTVPNDTILTVRILGSGFTEGSTVSWALAGVATQAVTTLPPVQFVTSRELHARIAVSRDAPLALYDAVVTAAGGKRGIGVEKLEVVARPILLPLESWTVRSEATDVNDHGVMVGWGADRADLFRALRWTPVAGGWTVEELRSSLAGPGMLTSARAVNNDGYVLLSIRRSGESSHAFSILTPSGVEVPLEATWVQDMNNLGTIIGRYAGQDVAWLQTTATSWSGPVPLQAPPGYVMGGLNDINANNDIVGRLTRPGSNMEWSAIWVFEGGRWRDPVLVDGDPGAAITLNDTRSLAGALWPCTDSSCSSLPVAWASAGSEPTLLPVEYSLTGSGMVADMNNGGRIVGRGRVKVGKRGASVMAPVVWVPGMSSPVDLGTRVRDARAEVRAVNNGWPSLAVGSISRTLGDEHATVWIVF